MPTLLEIFPDARQLLALEPEELAGALIEIIPGVSQSAGFMIENFTVQVFPQRGGGYGPGIFQEVVLALAFAEVVAAENSRTRRAKCYPDRTTVLGDKARASTNLGVVEIMCQSAAFAILVRCWRPGVS